MKKDLFSLVFKRTWNARELNIGDTVLLSHTEDGFIIWDGSSTYGTQIKSMDRDIESLLDFVSNRRNARLVIWDDENHPYLHDTMVEVAAITDDHIVIVLDENVQEALMKDMDERENRQVDDFLKNLFSDICEAVDEEIDRSCECCEEKREEEEETSVFSELGSSFGKINTNQFRLSINGLAVRGKDGKYVTFNPETRELVEVTTGFFDEMRDLLFVMPATELEVGDIILHQNKPYYISYVKENTVKGIDFEDAVESVLVPKTNVFGMKYYTKVFNCLGTNNVLGSDLTANPMMAYALMGGKDFDLSKMMMFQALSGQGNGIADFSENPIMLMALMSNEKGGGDLSDFAKMQVLSQLAGKKKETKATKETKVKEN